MKILTSIFYILFSTLIILPVFSQKTEAISENVIIAQLQTGVSGFASEEFILLYNYGAEKINVTNWCTQYASSNTLEGATDDVSFSDLKCIESQNSSVALWLPSGGTVSFATSEFVAKQNKQLLEAGLDQSFAVDFLFNSGMVNANRHLRLIDATGNEVDRVGWGNAIRAEGDTVVSTVPGELMSRNLESLTPDTDDNNQDFTLSTILSPLELSLEEVISVCPNLGDDFSEVPDGFLEDENGDCYEDYCSNVSGLQIDLPDGFELDADGLCVEIVLEDRQLIITELYPDAPSYDTGNEFIELYNPHDTTVFLAGYRLQVGPDYTKEFVFDNGELKPDEYRIFSDSETGIVLPNTNGVALKLVAPNGDEVSESEAYANAEDTLSWALINDEWGFTNQITPETANLPFLEESTKAVGGAIDELATCGAGRYRHPVTNRCRNIESATSQLVPCRADQYRNPETNRCRKIATSSGLTPCRENQERNPETNRCRNIASTSSLKPCNENQERNPETNRCRNVSVLGASSEDELAVVSDIAVEDTAGSINWGIIVIAMGATVSYMLYEWRAELQQKIWRLKRA